ncbi:hypothetical protein BH11PLA1_BH11PLA1_05910 [soil metagenome]
MPGIYSQILLHIVFSTKHREPWITPDVGRWHNRSRPLLPSRATALGVLAESCVLAFEGVGRKGRGVARERRKWTGERSERSVV